MYLLTRFPRPTLEFLSHRHYCVQSDLQCNRSFKNHAKSFCRESTSTKFFRTSKPFTDFTRKWPEICEEKLMLTIYGELPMCSLTLYSLFSRYVRGTFQFTVVVEWFLEAIYHLRQYLQHRHPYRGTTSKSFVKFQEISAGTTLSAKKIESADDQMRQNQ